MQLMSPPALRPTLLGNEHVAVSGHPLATAVAHAVLRAGGNAVDAGVAGGFALNVVQPDMANLGGVAPIVIRTAETGSVTTISGVGRWPLAATRERVSASGGGFIPVSERRWVTPATVDAWLTALQHYGSLSTEEVLGPAIELASRGFPANYFLINNLTSAREQMFTWPHSREVFFPNDETPRVGERVVQTALAGTLLRLVEAERRAGGSRETGIRAARDEFYRGEIAHEVGRFAEEIGAFLRTSDLQSFSVKEEEPVSVTYRGRTVYACGPWSQGPAVLQALNILEQFDIAGLDGLDRTHVTVEAVNSALADRNRWYGDPEVVNVPLARLLSKTYAAERAGSISMERATPSPHGERPGRASRDTTYICVIDGAGNAFSATPSDSTILTTPMIPGLGFAPSDRGLQASLNPADPNVIAPGKRPRLTPNPGLVVGDGQVLAYGSPGGDVQVQAMTQFLVNALDLKLELQAAVEAPRWASYSVPLTEDPHPATPNLLRVERPLLDAHGAELAERGHLIEAWPPLSAYAGGVCAASRDVATGTVSGGADPRRMSYGMVW